MSDDGPIPSPDIESVWKKFYYWNGDDPAPAFSHRTSEGTFRIVMSVPGKTVKVYWNDKFLGYDDFRFGYVAHNVQVGNYDQDSGVALSSLIPASPADWNGF